MARISYDQAAAAAFRSARHLDPDGLTHWREAIARHLTPRPGMQVLDLGAGTGMWAGTLAEWYGIEVIAVEPSDAMREQSSYPGVLAGQAEAIPLADSSVDGAWMSKVIHHIADLPTAAAELRRVLRPSAPLLIRSVFAGRYGGSVMLHFFPEAARVLDSFPSVEQVRAAFEPAGFDVVALEQVPEVTAESIAAVEASISRDAATPLRLISEREYQAGLARLREAARSESGPVIEHLDLLVLRRAPA